MSPGRHPRDQRLGLSGFERTWDGKGALSSNRRAAIVVLAVKVKPPSAVARKSARTLTAPRADGVLATVSFW
jgi:hypothetical protein